MKKVFTLLLATVLFSSMAQANVSLTAYEGSASKTASVTSDAEWTAILAEYPNAIAYGDATTDNIAFAANHNNVVLRHAGAYDDVLEVTTPDSYDCQNLVLKDLQQWGLNDSPMNTEKMAKTGFYSPVTFDVVAGSYSRKLYTGYNSVCVPFAIKAADFTNGQILAYSQYILSSNDAQFSVQSNVSAGTGVIIKMDADLNWKADLAGMVVVGKPANESCQGVFVATDEYAGTYYSVNTNTAIADTYAYFSKLANTLYPFRSCVKIEGVPSNVSPRLVVLNTEEATKLDAINANTENAKFMQNGKLMIRHNGQVFDAAGKIIK